MLDRDWQADWNWVNSPDVWITDRVQELANYWLLRAKELEDFLKDVQRIVGRALENTIQGKIAAERRVRELEEETRKLLGALEALSKNSVWPFKDGEADCGQYNGYFKALEDARKLLAALNKKEVLP